MLRQQAELQNGKLRCAIATGSEEEAFVPLIPACLRVQWDCRRGTGDLLRPAAAPWAPHTAVRLAGLQKAPEGKAKASARFGLLTDRVPSAASAWLKLL